MRPGHPHGRTCAAQISEDSAAPRAARPAPRPSGDWCATFGSGFFSHRFDTSTAPAPRPPDAPVAHVLEVGHRRDSVAGARRDDHRRPLDQDITCGVHSTMRIEHACHGRWPGAAARSGWPRRIEAGRLRGSSQARAQRLAGSTDHVTYYDSSITTIRRVDAPAAPAVPRARRGSTSIFWPARQSPPGQEPRRRRRRGAGPGQGRCAPAPASAGIQPDLQPHAAAGISPAARAPCLRRASYHPQPQSFSSRAPSFDTPTVSMTPTTAPSNTAAVTTSMPTTSTCTPAIPGTVLTETGLGRAAPATATAPSRHRPTPPTTSASPTKAHPAPRSSFQPPHHSADRPPSSTARDPPVTIASPTVTGPRRSRRRVMRLRLDAHITVTRHADECRSIGIRLRRGRRLQVTSITSPVGPAGQTLPRALDRSRAPRRRRRFSRRRYPRRRVRTDRKRRHPQPQRFRPRSTAAAHHRYPTPPGTWGTTKGRPNCARSDAGGGHVNDRADQPVFLDQALRRLLGRRRADDVQDTAGSSVMRASRSYCDRSTMCAEGLQDRRGGAPRRQQRAPARAWPPRRCLVEAVFAGQGRLVVLHVRLPRHPHRARGDLKKIAGSSFHPGIDKAES